MAAAGSQWERNRITASPLEEIKNIHLKKRMTKKGESRHLLLIKALLRSSVCRVCLCLQNRSLFSARDPSVQWNPAPFFLIIWRLAAEVQKRPGETVYTSIISPRHLLIGWQRGDGTKQKQPANFNFNFQALFIMLQFPSNSEWSILQWNSLMRVFFILFFFLKERIKVC